MEEKKIDSLKRELKLKQFQFNSIYEFSSSLYSSFDIDSIIRIYFSTIMGQMGISKTFFFDSENKLFRKRGFKISEDELEVFLKEIKVYKNTIIKETDGEIFYLKVDDLPEQFVKLKSILLLKQIHYLVNISESKKRKIVLGLGYKFNRIKLGSEDIEFSFFISKFASSAIDNAFMIEKIIESKRIEHEINIARDIQLSLLPQKIPELESFEISVIYEPINEVGGDYYDILKEKKGITPVLIADVEGKGLSAALLAASSQAVFRSLNELYFFEPAKFISKANSLIYDLTRGKHFITLFWMLIDDAKKSVTYVNAGHVEPFLISKSKVVRLSTGGLLTGFVGNAKYEKETLQLKKGDIIVAFTDGVPEVENLDEREFGQEAIIDFIKKNKKLSAYKISEKLFKTINNFSHNKKFRDDFTLIIIKVK